MFKALVWRTFAIGVPVALLIQVVPYGHDHTNPPVQTEPQWNSPQTRELAVRACFDCHSDQTVWPWYSNVAPVSWLIERDVEAGRRRLNFSEWGTQRRGAREAGRLVQEGEMPPFYYVTMHPSAGLSATENATLVQGLDASLGTGAGQPAAN